MRSDQIEALADRVLAELDATPLNQEDQHMVLAHAQMRLYQRQRERLTALRGQLRGLLRDLEEEPHEVTLAAAAQ